MSDPNHNLADANELPNSELPQGELHDLKRQARTNALRLKIAQQNAALAALRGQGYSDKLEGFSYNDPSNYVDLRDYLFQSPPFFGAMPTTRNDRDQGRDFPVFRTEQELAVIRGAARLITASNPIAVGVLTTLTNYVIGNGFHYAVIPRETGSGAAELAKTAGAVVADFLSENNWSGDLDRELFQRSRVDGEYFLSLWHVGDGHVQARAVEPDQVTEPGNKTGIDQWLGASQQTDWTFGVHSDVDDAQAVHGFFVQWTNRDLDWNYLPGGNEPILPPDGAGSWMEHAKLNVVRSVKRGLSDFYPIQGNLEIARRVLRNMGEGSAVQAAIAWIQEVAPGVTQAQVNTGTMSRADASYTTQTQSGSRTHWLQQYDPATILKVPSGQKYLPGPLGAQHAPNFITAAEALLRSVAVRWSLPENLVTGTAENNNFASSLVAESPFVKFAESQQQFYAQRDRRTLERVLWFAWLAGRFGDVEWNAVKRSLHIEVTPPQIEVRDPEKETQVRKTLHDAGLLSRKTWSAQEGLDYEQEQKNLQQEAAAAAPAADSQSSPNSRRTAKLEELADLLERFWDPAKHPRGGYPQNTGWFSPGGGSSDSDWGRPSDPADAIGKPWGGLFAIGDETQGDAGNVNPASQSATTPSTTSKQVPKRGATTGAQPAGPKSGQNAPAHDPKAAYLRDFNNNHNLTLVAALKTGKLSAGDILRIKFTDDEIRQILKSAEKPGSDLNLTFYTAQNLPAPLRADAERDFADLPGDEKYAMQAFVSNQRRARTILMFRNRAFQQYVGMLYELLRGLNPTHFLIEKGVVVAIGKEPVLGGDASRLDALKEMLIYLAIMKGTSWGASKMTDVIVGPEVSGEITIAFQGGGKLTIRRGAEYGPKELESAVNRAATGEDVTLEPPAPKPPRPSLTVVPRVTDNPRAFRRWFNELTPEEFKIVWSNPKLRKAVEDGLRWPGRKHEWLMIARTPKFKEWGITAEQVAEMTTPTARVRFKNPVGGHKGKGATKTHNELLRIIDSSPDFATFKTRLQQWANERLEGGAEALPLGLKP